MLTEDYAVVGLDIGTTNVALSILEGKEVRSYFTSFDSNLNPYLIHSHIESFVSECNPRLIARSTSRPCSTDSPRKPTGE